MVTFRLRSQERQDPLVSYAWDTLWSDTELQFDWVLTTLTTKTPQVLQSQTEMATSIAIQLCTWRHAAPGDKLDDDDPQGWWADQFSTDPGQGPLGSRLYLLYRRPLNDATARDAVLYAQEAMRTFISQGVFVRVDISTEMDKIRSILNLNINCYGQDGSLKYSAKYSRAWQQLMQFTPVRS